MAHLTDAKLRALKPESKNYELADDSCPGLRIRISTKGGKSWFYRYRVDEKLIKVTLGKYPTLSLASARTLWHELAELKHTGGDPRAEMKRRKQEAKFALVPETTKENLTNKDTVAMLVNAYIDHISQVKRSWRKDQQALERDFIPLYWSRSAPDIKRADIRNTINNIRSRGSQTQANRVLACIRAMFNWALETDWPQNRALIQGNPCAGIKMSCEKAKERALNDMELKILLSKLPESGISMQRQDLIRFILLTGCRAGEACTLEFVDLFGDLWRLPEHKSKNGRTHTVFLSDQAQELLKKQSKRCNSKKWVFHNPRSKTGHERGDTLAKALKDALPTIELEAFTLHDLRRSMATWLGENQVDEAIHDRMLNHVTGGIRKTYNTAKYNESARKWWAMWAQHLNQLVDQ